MKVLGLIVLLLGLFYSEGSSSMPQQCSYGPSYWCHSLRSAKSCGAVQHCIQTVWEKQTLPKDNDGVCQICLAMVKQARDTLQSNDTQMMIKQVFEGSCNLIPIRLVREECDGLADGFIPELIETLSSEMDPEVVCATAGLCNSVSVDRLIKEYLLTHNDMQTNDENYCTDCHVFLTDVSKAVRSHSRNEVLDHLLAICGRVSSLTDGCRMLVQANFESIYDFLAYNMNSDKICDLFGLCGAFTTKRIVQEDIPCEFCEDIVKQWREKLASNTTVEQFKEVLVGICANTGKFQVECDSLVEQYYQPLYDFLLSQLNPKEICTLAGLCGKNSVFNTKVPLWTSFEIRPQDQLFVPVDSPDTSENMIGQDEANSYKGDLLGTHEMNPYKIDSKKEKATISVSSHGSNGIIEKKKSDKCVMCEFTLHYLQELLHDKPTKDEVENALKKVCAQLPHRLEEQCDDYVDSYSDQLIELLILEMDPNNICPMLGLCPGKKLTILEDVTCTLCEYAMTSLDQMLTDKKTEASIRHALKSVCSILPKTVREDCKAFVDQYTDQIVHMLINDLDPDQVCTQLGLCKDTVASLPASEKQLPISRMFVSNAIQDPAVIGRKTPAIERHQFWDQSIECILCEFIMAKLDKVIANKTVQDEIKADVSMICLELPNTLMNDCLGFIEEYGQGMLELVLNELDPTVVCRDIKLCKANVAHDLPKATVDVATVNVAADHCAICEEIVELAYHAVKTEHIPETVEDLIKYVCDPIKNMEERETCHFLVVMYGPYMTKLMDELKKPLMVCQAIKECPPSDKPLLLGATKCSWGPSYWCKTPQHAKSCSATKHCQENVWGKQVPAA